METAALILVEVKARNLLKSVNSIHDLLVLKGLHFVDVAYLSLLGRPPDRAGRDFFFKRLQAGVSKKVILYDIACSSEASVKDVPLDGLDHLISEVRRKRRWWWRFLAGKLWMERRSNRIEFRKEMCPWSDNLRQMAA